MKLRSADWFDLPNELGMQNRSVLRTMGWSREFFAGKPVIAIANSWSEFNNCNLGLKVVAEAVKRGVIAGGGVPLEFNTLSLGEELMKPSAMLYRNLVSMEVEEMLRANPVDGVVLLGGCDKTIPALLMGAASANLPSLLVCAGSKLVVNWNGQPIGSGTDLWYYSDQRRAGLLSDSDWQELEETYSCSAGTCNTMGSASTMAILAEALGVMLPDGATLPAVDARRLAHAERSGRQIVELVRRDIRPAQILTRAAFENALRVYFAVGGSTNAILHLLALAGRLMVPLSLDDFDSLARTTPLVVNVRPTGTKLMHDLHDAGGVPAVQHRIQDLLHLDAPTITGRPIADNLRPTRDETVICPPESTMIDKESLVVLHGNLAPRGAILRTATASRRLWQHCGPAFVFNSYQDMMAQIDDPDLPVTAESILVLRYAGAVGVPGLPEWGAIPIPKKLLQQGVVDMVRLSDARMSGTSSGTVVLHITPEAAIGGALALVETGDLIALDVEHRTLNLVISDSALAERQTAWRPPVSEHRRGYPALYREHVLQPDEGCDFDFLRPKSADDLKFVQPVIGRS